jgi:hypothetical protein
MAGWGNLGKVLSAGKTIAGLGAMVGVPGAGLVSAGLGIAQGFAPGKTVGSVGGMASMLGAVGGQQGAVKSWVAGGRPFSLLADGRISVVKKNGVVKTYRPYRPVSIPRKWNARSMGRVATALKRQRKTAQKVIQMTGGSGKRGKA